MSAYMWLRSRVCRNNLPDTALKPETDLYATYAVHNYKGGSTDVLLIEIMETSVDMIHQDTSQPQPCGDRPVSSEYVSA